MKLDVLESGQSWYSGGLNFTCTQCGNCCTGGPGYVWISGREIVRLARHLQLTPAQVVERYCRKVNGRFSLNERRNARGEYDCVFMTTEPVRPAPADSSGHDTAVVQTRRSCSIYAVRPLQCRTWPFWTSVVRTPEAWRAAGKTCHGINRGEHFSHERIESLRTARDWPEKPPTSA
jgi:Fe-S-cluster containining protein